MTKCEACIKYDMISEFINAWRKHLYFQQRAVFIKKVVFLAMLCALFSPIKTRRRRKPSPSPRKPGLNGFCKADKWLPVHVTVENTGADVNARVQASYKNSLDGQTDKRHGYFPACHIAQGIFSLRHAARIDAEFYRQRAGWKQDACKNKLEYQLRQ